MNDFWILEFWGGNGKLTLYCDELYGDKVLHWFWFCFSYRFDSNFQFFNSDLFQILNFVLSYWFYVSYPSRSLPEEEEEEENLTDYTPYIDDISKVDIDSDVFKALPLEIQHAIITDMKETGKRSSWKKIKEMPKVCL